MSHDPNEDLHSLRLAESNALDLLTTDTLEKARRGAKARIDRARDQYGWESPHAVAAVAGYRVIARELNARPDYHPEPRRSVSVEPDGDDTAGTPAHNMRADLLAAAGHLGAFHGYNTDALAARLRAHAETIKP